MRHAGGAVFSGMAVCGVDVDALAFIFAWALEGAEPSPPGAGPYDCSLD